MGSIDKIEFESRGARGCTNSDYNVAKTICCKSYVVEDDELNDVYFDPIDLEKVIDVTYSGNCPLCGNPVWDYCQVANWPQENTGWEWAQSSNQGRTTS